MFRQLRKIPYMEKPMKIFPGEKSMAARTELLLVKTTSIYFMKNTEVINVNQ